VSACVGSRSGGSRTRVRAEAGFTLLEISVAVLILALMMTFIYETLFNTIRQRNAQVEGLEGPKIDQAIMDQVMGDLRFVYYRQGLLPGDSGFWGRSRQLNGTEADRVDFLTCRTSKLAELEETTQALGNSPLIEVGYACRQNDANPRWLELWRREDYFVDDDPTDGGRYDLVYDKIRRFDLHYYPPTEDRAENDNGLDEWDTKIQKKLPYAIVVTLYFDVREPISDQPQGMVRRIVLLTPARSLPPDATTGMDAGMSAMR